MKVALLSDTHISAEGEAFNANLRMAIAWIQQEEPEFVVHLGDITADGWARPEQFALAARLLGCLKPALRLVPGNHDIGDNPSGRGVPQVQEFSQERLDAYRQFLGPDYWSLQAGGWRILGLNTMLFCTGSEEEERQFAWLEAQLQGFRGPVGVMLHKPLCFRALDDNPAQDRYVPLEPRRRMMETLGRNDLRFIASGHVHQGRQAQIAGVTHIWMPSTSFCIPNALQGRLGEKKVAVGLLELRSDGFEFSSVTPEGMVRHNLLHHPEVYPQVVEIGARLSAREREL